MKAIEKIRNSFEKVSNDLSCLTRDVTINYMSSSSGVVIIAPDYYWAELSPEQKNKQIQLKRKYDPISEIIKSYLNNAPADIITHLRDFKNYSL